MEVLSPVANRNSTIGSSGGHQAAFTFNTGPSGATFGADLPREEEVTRLARRLVQAYGGKVIVTIDGPASSGKSTQAENLARRLGLPYVDSGSLFRCIAYACIGAEAPMNDGAAVVQVARTIPGRVQFRWSEDSNGVSHQHIFLDGDDVTREIRVQQISQGARMVSSHQAVRDILRDAQLEIAQGGCVTAGRAQGSEVFPDATVKIYLTASIEERARRRLAQELNIPQHSVDASSLDYARVFRELSERDHGDTTRSVGRLVKSPGSIEIDSSNMTESRMLDRLTGEVALALSFTIGRPPIKPSQLTFSLPDLSTLS